MTNIFKRKATIETSLNKTLRNKSIKMYPKTSIPLDRMETCRVLLKSTCELLQKKRRRQQPPPLR